MLYIFLCYSLPVCAQDLCVGERKELLDTFDNRLTICNEFGDVSDEDKMIAACKKGVRCVKEMMDDVFDTYYSEDAEASKNLFVRYIYDTYHIQEHLIRGNRLGRYIHNAPMYDADIEQETYQIIYDLARAYLKEMRSECEDIDGSGIRQLDGFEEAVD